MRQLLQRLRERWPLTRTEMKPAPFDYRAPDTIDEVVELLAAHGGDAKIMAGGQSFDRRALSLAKKAVLRD